MKKNIILLVFCNIFFCVACNLNFEPESTISVDSFWRTEDDAKAGVYGIYGRFRALTSDALYKWGGGRSEEMEAGGVNASEGFTYFMENRMSSVNAGPNWLGLYLVMNDANSVIKFVPNILFKNEDEKNNLLAQAYAMRAYIYFILVRTWGGVPIVLVPTEEFDPSLDSSYKARNSVEEVFDRIKEDIKKALELFGENNKFPTGRCYWSKPAVNALKGDVYLWSGKLLGGETADFEVALLALQEVQTADVELLASFDNVFRDTQKGNKEILFAARHAEKEASNNYVVSMYIRNEDIPSDAEEIGKKLVGKGGGLNRWIPSKILREEFVDDDTRKNSTFAELWFTREGVRKLYTSVALKYKGKVSGGQRLFLDDVVIYRYADVLLMIAEAKNALNLDPTGEINQIRKRAYGNKFSSYEFTKGTKEENDQAILRERKLELALEGKRWWDLIRFGKVFELVTSMADKTEGHILFPISQATLTANNKLEQNEAYK